MKQYIKSLLRESLLNEAVSRGVLYHFTSSMGFTINVKNHGFKFHRMELPYYEDPSFSKYESALSTTRLYNLKWGKVRFNLNGDYISSKYVIKPVHYYNRQDKAEYRTKKGNSRDGVPINQYEETILSKETNHLMSLNNNIVFSVDILVSDNGEEFISKYGVELKELSDLGIPYNFVTSFKPFKGIDKVSVSDVKQSVNELLRLRDEGDVIKFLQGKDNIREILSDIRVIIMVCSRGYLRILKEMVRLGVDLGINDYDDTEHHNMWTGMSHKSDVNLGNYLAIKAAGNNTDVLSILLTSDKVPINLKYKIAVKYKLEQFYDMLYNSDLDIDNKIELSINANNYLVFDKYFDDSENKHSMCVLVNIRGTKINIDKKFVEKCLSSDINNSLKYSISTKYGIGNSEQYYEEPIASNDEDEDFPF